MSRWLGCFIGFTLACNAVVEDTPADGESNGGSSAGDGAGGSEMTGTGASAGAGSSGITAGPTRLFSKLSSTVSKVDLVFMIDNSKSMSDKQELLRQTVPELLARLTNPACLSADGQAAAAPAPGADCPPGQRREFPPVSDINVAILSSSLGDAGANAACPGQGFGEYVADRQDMAHLVGSLARGAGAGTTPEGFLSWRAGSTQPQAFNQAFQRLVSSVGENGCDFEQSLESWYRFLADPVPYRQLARVQCSNSSSTATNCVRPATGADNRILLDDVLLQQRSAFLRPDSLLAVVMLSDENDCSLQVGNQTWVVSNLLEERPMFRGSSTCASDPNDKCCYSCPLTPPAGCAPDPICAADEQAGTLANRLPELQDGKNLRCWDQKRRFGVDFLYPTERYVNALTQPDLCWNALDLSLADCPADDVRPNPLFIEGRPRERVILAGILGVPWQAIASDQDASGRPLTDPSQQLRFQSPTELTANGTWAEIVGSPGVRWRAGNGSSQPEQQGVPGVPPTLAQMIESTSARAGVATGNAINGREYDTALGAAPVGTSDDLQYACIFQLPVPRDCALLNSASDACDCYDGVNDRPLCEQQPGVSAASTVQHWAKAYPSSRQLQVLRDFGANSALASICARNVSVETAPDYAYRPALDALLERVAPQLNERCLPEALPVDGASGTPACHVTQAAPLNDGACVCDASRGQRVPEPSVQQAARQALASDPTGPCSDPDCSRLCLCELTPLTGEALRACQQEEDATGAEGWCYIDAQRNIGNAALLSVCPAGQDRRLRFLGAGPSPGATVATVCADD